MFASAGRPWLGVTLIVDLGFFVLYALSHEVLLLVGGGGVSCLLLLFLIFFRDPERVLASGVVAPADGRVLHISREGEKIRVATFMNVTNVHVNRVPYPGYLLRVEDGGHGKRPAFSPGAKGNVQKRYLCGTPIGVVEVVQITGLVARRCVAYKSPLCPLRKGERFGMILFGSRVDVVMPAKRVRVLVKVGEKISACSTSLAEVLEAT